MWHRLVERVVRRYFCEHDFSIAYFSKIIGWKGKIKKRISIFLRKRKSKIYVLTGVLATVIQVCVLRPILFLSRR